MAATARLPLLDAAACEDWVLRVLLLRRHWRQRHAAAPFFTLGLAAYLDAGFGGSYRHPSLRAGSNRLLLDHFGELLEQVAAALATHLGQPARLAADEAALPGFHIYLPHPAFGERVAKVHRDLQHRDAFPGEVPPEAERPGAADAPLSFTLALSNPPGSGIALWPDDAGADGSDGAGEFLPYREGELVLHDGQCRHQAVLACTGPLERITLQGHGIRRGGQWLLYW